MYQSRRCSLPGGLLEAADAQRLPARGGYGLAAVALLFFAGCATESPQLPAPAAIDRQITRLMAAEDVKGLAIAVIDGRETAHIAAYGFRNVERRLPLDTDTVMYGASLTKTAFAYFVLQLVDEGRLDLDRPLAEYLQRPLIDYDDYEDLAGDPRWRQLTARHVLNHSTGFANFRWLEDDSKLRFHFTPGERYGYSGEGFYLLQFAIEEGLGLDVKAEMQLRVFDRFGMVNTSMRWRDDFADNLADGYRLDGSFEPHDERSNVSAAGSMDTTIADQARLWTGILAGDGLSAASRRELVRPHLPIRIAGQFPSLRSDTDPRGAEIGLAAGLGLVTFQSPKGLAWFKGGHNDWTGNMVLCLEIERRCVVLLANSVRAERIFPAIVEFVLGDTGAPWWWEYGDEAF